MRVRSVIVALFLLGMTAAGGRAQTYDTPAFQTPYGESGLGLYLVFQNEVDDIGVMGTWRQAGDDLDLGLRGGLLDAGGSVGIFGGVDLSNELVRATEDFPLDVAWVSGIGLGVVPDFDFSTVRVPLGATFGREIEAEDVVILPYFYPRLALDFLFLDDPPGDQTDLHLDVDLGADLDFGQDWRLRFAFTLGHSEAIGLGLSFARF